MTNEEKGAFCAFAASLLTEPDAEMVASLDQEGVGSLLDGCVRACGGDEDLAALFIGQSRRDGFLTDIQAEYARLFGPWEGRKISLVESTYKPWTADKTCPLGFSGEKGLLMGDCALHIQNIFRTLSLKVPPDFLGMPDHLVLELELLSYLYRFASEDQIGQFIEDHLDWIPNLRDELQRADPGFYGRAVERLLDFLNRERPYSKEGQNESQSLH